MSDEADDDNPFIHIQQHDLSSAALQPSVVESAVSNDDDGRIVNNPLNAGVAVELQYAFDCMYRRVPSATLSSFSSCDVVDLTFHLPPQHDLPTQLLTHVSYQTLERELHDINQTLQYRAGSAAFGVVAIAIIWIAPCLATALGMCIHHPTNLNHTMRT